LIGYIQDQQPQAPFRRLRISFSQGGVWKTLINRYIGAIPHNGEASCAA
jgi:hypothetical protein